MRVLHLSDLHFGYLDPEQTKPAHYFESGHQVDRLALAHLLIADERLKANPPHLIVVSGDLGWRALASEYEIAFASLDALRRQWPIADWVICPGNHDVDWQSSDNAAQDAFLQFIERFHGPAFTSRFPLLTDRTGSYRHRLVDVLAKNDYLVVALNSAASLPAKVGANTPVFVDPNVLNDLTNRLAGAIAPLRLLVVHHHLLPVHEGIWQPTIDISAPPDAPDPTMLANTVLLQKWMARHGFTLVLHGHKHTTHCRETRMWRPHDPVLPGQRAVIVGAPSTGVRLDQISRDERLAFHVIDIRQLSRESFALNVDVRELVVRDTPGTRHLDAFSTRIGSDSPATPTVFSAESLDLCHAAIAAETAQSPDDVIHNFLSVVADSRWVLPSTGLLFGDRLDETTIDQAFRNLHPEYDSQTGWSDVAQVDRNLRQAQSHYRFVHGPRLFATHGQAHLGRSGNLNVSPIDRAVSLIRGENSSRAYAGLYNPELDTRDDEPLPAMVGLQFVQAHGRLDCVATFRNLELSFWWIVNFYECRKLLEWAATKVGDGVEPGRITFFAALAQWRANPEAPLIAEIDRMSAAMIAAITANVGRGQSEASARLSTLLLEKTRLTSDANLFDRGLLLLGTALAAFPDQFATDLARHLLDAAGAIADAMIGGSEIKQRNVARARAQLEEAARKLNATLKKST